MNSEDFYHDSLLLLLPGAPSSWPAIAADYSGRAYHNLDHLREMIGHLHASSTGIAPAAAPLFGLALIYHDVVYRAGRSDNEARSADRLVADLQPHGLSAADANYCRRLVMATKHHVPSASDKGDEALLIDLDLAVLARPANGYDEYAAAVRQEFSLFPGFLYRRGRKKALRHFLDQPAIYRTPHFRSLWEERARENMERELAGL